MTKTLEDAQKDWRMPISGGGGRCPCCDRYGRIYERAFNSTMARSLLWLVYNSPAGWVHVPSAAPQSIVRTNQLPTARGWYLVERQISDDPKVKHSGMWRPTERGGLFASGLVRIPRTVFTYDGNPIGHSQDTISIDDAFKTRFDYEQVMAEVAAHWRASLPALGL